MSGESLERKKDGERKKERKRTTKSNKVIAASSYAAPRVARLLSGGRIDRIPQNNAQVGDGAHSRRDGFTFQSETPLPLTFQWRLVSRSISPHLAPPRFTSPRLACQTPAFLRKCLLPLRSLFERKRHGRAFRCETLSTRHSADTSADRMFHKQTRSLSSLNSRHPPYTKLTTADCNYSALSVNETSARRRRRPTRYDGSPATRTR